MRWFEQRSQKTPPHLEAVVVRLLRSTWAAGVGTAVGCGAARKPGSPAAVVPALVHGADLEHGAQPDVGERRRALEAGLRLGVVHPPLLSPVPLVAALRDGPGGESGHGSLACTKPLPSPVAS